MMRNHFQRVRKTKPPHQTAYLLLKLGLHVVPLDVPLLVHLQHLGNTREKRSQGETDWNHKTHMWGPHVQVGLSLIIATGMRGERE